MLQIDCPLQLLTSPLAANHDVPNLHERVIRLVVYSSSRFQAEAFNLVQLSTGMGILKKGIGNSGCYSALTLWQIYRDIILGWTAGVQSFGDWENPAYPQSCVATWFTTAVTFCFHSNLLVAYCLRLLFLAELDRDSDAEMTANFTGFTFTVSSNDPSFGRQTNAEYAASHCFSNESVHWSRFVEMPLDGQIIENQLCFSPIR